jgi:hypothetical protein
MHARFARRPDQRITLPTAQCSGHPSGITHDCVSETTVFRFRSVTIGPPEPLSHLSARLEPMAPWHAHGLAAHIGWYALSDTDTLFVIATKPNETWDAFQPPLEPTFPATMSNPGRCLMPAKADSIGCPSSFLACEGRCSIHEWVS